MVLFGFRYVVHSSPDVCCFVQPGQVTVHCYSGHSLVTWCAICVVFAPTIFTGLPKKRASKGRRGMARFIRMHNVS